MVSFLHFFNPFISTNGIVTILCNSFGQLPPLANTHKGSLYDKPYLSSPGISWKAQKDQVNTIFPSTFWLKKRPYFPTPKSPKQELFNSQSILSFHQLFGSKKDRISHSQNDQNKNFSVISKYHISINFLAEKYHIFHL